VGKKLCLNERTEEHIKKLAIRKKQSNTVNFFWNVFVYKAKHRPGKEEGRRVCSHAGELQECSQL